VTIELDVYGGDLEGLVVAEVEFASEEDADAFDPPAWLGREVTDDPRYKNQRLARDGAPAR
jgi:adenylate cyclase